MFAGPTPNEFRHLINCDCTESSTRLIVSATYNGDGELEVEVRVYLAAEKMKLLATVSQIITVAGQSNVLSPGVR